MSPLESSRQRCAKPHCNRAAAVRYFAAGAAHVVAMGAPRYHFFRQAAYDFRRKLGEPSPKCATFALFAESGQPDRKVEVDGIGEAVR